MVILNLINQFFIIKGSIRVCSPGIYKDAPFSKQDQTSLAMASKPGLATWLTREPGLAPKIFLKDRTKLQQPLCRTKTPLGFPVDPEV
jgi:hypothetical protein